MNIIQAASAVYILTLALAAVALAVQHVWTGKPLSGHITGYPAFVAAVACVICAITTIQVIS